MNISQPILSLPIAMQQYISRLLIVVLGTSLTFIVTPCQAETPVKTNSQNTDNISSLSSNSPSTIQLSDFANTTNSKPPILAEAAKNSSAANANITATKPQSRIPIFSRIFPTPSMRQ
ncbi:MULTISPECIES: hypothetical protein [unclassified Nostoc]|uniref:hypothetical protein n=2 Tax=Nostoc TaxID=1177 RepID=UPI00260B536E|nr:hypothetical protein [Nostoc sp. S13]MDF5735251.1 hypothetical protein [Nostoc sp. S13]